MIVEKKESRKHFKKIRKNTIQLKRPQTPYFLFCSKKREELKKAGNDKRLTAKELGAMWKKLSEEEKKSLIEQYEKDRIEYERRKKELEEEEKSEDEEDNKSNRKIKVKTKKNQNYKNNIKVCNCGECDECLIRKKIKEEEDEEREDNKLAKKRAKKAVDDDDDD